jgi:hypothetical protein
MAMDTSAAVWLIYGLLVIVLMGGLFLMWGKSRSGRSPKDFHDAP